MIYLPKNIAPLLALAAKDGGRYSMTGLHVVELKGDHCRLEATDGKRLGVVKSGAFNDPLGVPEDRGDVFKYLAPASLIKKAIADTPKDGVVALCCREKTVFAYAAGSAREEPAVEGRFPTVDVVLPKRPPLVQVIVDADLLISVLKAAAAIALGDGSHRDLIPRVTLMVWGKDVPIGVVASNDAGQSFDGLLMPLSGGS